MIIQFKMIIKFYQRTKKKLTGSSGIAMVAYLFSNARLQGCLRACSKSSRVRQNLLIFEHRSAVYMRVNEQRGTENQRMMAVLGDFEQALSREVQRCVLGV